jgi:hypothetical protein
MDAPPTGPGFVVGAGADGDAAGWPEPDDEGVDEGCVVGVGSGVVVPPPDPPESGVRPGSS